MNQRGSAVDIKIATFNVEWMVSVFNGRWADWTNDIGIPASFSGRRLGTITLEPIDDVHGLCERVAGTIRSLNAQIIGIQEGPPLKSQMEYFVQKYLGDEYVVFTSNSRWQTIHALVHNSFAKKVTAKDPASEEVKILWKDIGFYPWGEIEEEFRRAHSFYRLPLMLTYEHTADSKLDILILHTKSKFSSLDLEGWLERDPEAMADALLARQKLSVEVYRVRRYIEAQIKGDVQNLVVMGDLNDGPLATEFEEEFLIHNILDELVGSILRPDLVMTHVLTPEQITSSWSAEFHNPLKGNEQTKELIDHIVISPAVKNGHSGFMLVENSGKVEIDAYDSHANGTFREKRPSDHRPVSVVLEAS